MKIIIIGSGLTARAAYHALTTHLSSLDHHLPSWSTSDSGLQIKLVEQTPRIHHPGHGLSISIPPNGLRALKCVSSDTTFERIKARGFPSPRKTFSNGDGDKLGVFEYGTGERYGKGFETIVIGEDDLVDELDVPMGDIIQLSSSSGQVRDAKLEGLLGVSGKVVRVCEAFDPSGVSEGVEVTFEDGRKEVVDLVIGADGWNSVVRMAIPDPAGNVRSKFDGINTIGGNILLSDISPRLRQVLDEHGEVLTFGRKGIFSFSLCSPSPSSPSSPAPVADMEKRALGSGEGYLQWWSIFDSTEPLPVTGFDFEVVKKQLMDKHGDWIAPGHRPSPSTSDTEKGEWKVYREILDLGFKDPLAVFASPRFHIPRISHWTNIAASGTGSSPTRPLAKGRIVLMGDAAHSTVPEIGQAASLAIEDALVYALVLKKTLAATPINHALVFEQSARAYEALRMKRVGKVLDIDGGNGCMTMEFGWFAQKMRDWALGWLCRAPEKMHDSFFMYDSQVAVEEYFKSDGQRC